MVPWAPLTVTLRRTRVMAVVRTEVTLGTILGDTLEGRKDALRFVDDYVQFC